MFYGLTQIEESYFADKVERFIAMAPCVFPVNFGKETHDKVVEYYDKIFNEAGLLYSGGRDKKANVEKLCAAFGEDSLECKSERIEAGKRFEARHAYASDLYF